MGEIAFNNRSGFFTALVESVRHARTPKAKLQKARKQPKRYLCVYLSLSVCVRACVLRERGLNMPLQGQRHDDAHWRIVLGRVICERSGKQQPIVVAHRRDDGVVCDMLVATHRHRAVGGRVGRYVRERRWRSQTLNLPLLCVAGRGYRPADHAERIWGERRFCFVWTLPLGCSYQKAVGSNGPLRLQKPRLPPSFPYA